jgi:hypothetical protein
MKTTKSTQLLRVPEATQYLADKLGQPAVTEKTMRAWISQRRIDVVKVGGMVYLTPEALDEMVEERPAAR